MSSNSSVLNFKESMKLRDWWGGGGSWMPMHTKCTKCCSTGKSREFLVHGANSVWRVFPNKRSMQKRLDWSSLAPDCCLFVCGGNKSVVWTSLGALHQTEQTNAWATDATIRRVNNGREASVHDIHICAVSKKRGCIRLDLSATSCLTQTEPSQAWQVLDCH